MARENGLDLRTAGAQISASGLDNAVIRRDEGDITTHRGRQRESDDAEKPARKPQREERREDRGTTREDRRKTREETPDLDNEPEEEAEEGEFEDGDSHPRDDGDTDHEAATDDSEDDDRDAEDDDNEDSSSRREDDLDQKFTVKVNGKETSVPARELIAGYQRGKDYAEKTTTLSRRTRELDQSHGEVAEVYKSQLNRAAYTVKAVRSMLAGDIDSAEMRQLLATNPQQWSVQRQLMQDRLQAVDGVLNTIYQQYERHDTEFKATAKKNLQARAVHEAELIVAAIHDWNHAAGGGEPAKVKLGHYLNRNGFTADELKDVVDSRMLIIANKARLWDEQQARRAQPITKKAKPMPKVARATTSSTISRNDQQPAQSRQYQAAKVKAKKSGDMRDAGAAIDLLIRRQNRGTRN